MVSALRPHDVRVGQACGDHGPNGGVGAITCKKPMFPPRLPGLFGYGSAACATVSAGKGGGCTKAQKQHWDAKFNFNIIDKVRDITRTPPEV